MEKLIKYAIALFHFIVVGIHGIAHQIISVPLSILQFTSWGIAFEVTTFLSMISETLGVDVALWGLIKKEQLKEI